MGFIDDNNDAVLFVQVKFYGFFVLLPPCVIAGMEFEIVALHCCAGIIVVVSK